MSGKKLVASCLLGIGLAVAAYAAIINCTANVVDNAKGRVQDHDPVLAWNGKNFGMVWVTDGTKLMFVSLGADGKRVSGPRLLYDCHKPFDGYYVEYPDIVWTGGSYLIVYSDTTDGRSYFSLQVDAAGTILKGPTYLKTEPKWTYEWGGAVAWNGSEAGFVYVNQDTNVYFKRLSKTGALVDKQVLIASNSGHAYAHNPLAKIAWNGREYGVAWTTKDGKGINYQAVSSKGALVGSRASLAKTSGQYDFLSLCPGKKGSFAFGMVFTEYLMNVRTVVYFTQVGSDGKLFHKAVNVRSCPRTARYEGDWPQVAWNAAKGVFHVSWQDNRIEPGPDPYVTSYYNFFMRSIKTNGKFGSAETMLNVKYKETGYHVYECGAAFNGTQFCIGFIRNVTKENSSDRHYRAYSVCVKPR